MQVVKITTLNEDGSIAFEGFFGPNEVQFLLETGVNIMLQQGAIGVIQAQEDEGDEFVDLDDTDEDPTPRH